MKPCVRILILCLCLIVCTTSPCLAKEWRGIVPLHATRTDVIKLLGNPTHLQWDYRDYFILNDETVTLSWIDPTCVRKYPVEPDREVRPDDLVLNIFVTPKTPLNLDALHLQPMKLYSTDCIGSGCIYIDSEEGFAYSTSKGGVTGMSYSPPAAEFKARIQDHKACQALTASSS